MLDRIIWLWNRRKEQRMAMDLLNVPPSADLPDQVPEGDYTLVLRRAEKVYSREKNIPAVMLSFSTKEEESPDQMPVDLMHWAGLEGNVRLVARNLDILRALGGVELIERLDQNLKGNLQDNEVNNLLKELEGRDIRAHLVEDEYDGRGTNRIASVLPF